MNGWRGMVGAAVSIGVIVALLGGVTNGFVAWTTDAARARAVRAQPVRVQEVALLDMHGASQAIAADPRSTIVDFVYTRCPTLCGMLGSTYQRLQMEIQRRQVGSQVRLLTISFDPRHDNPEQLRAYATAMHPNPAIWTLATLADTVPLAGLLRTFGVRVIPDGADGFVHNAALHVVSPAGWLVGILPIDATDEAIDLALSHAQGRAANVGSGAEATPVARMTAATATGIR